MHCEFRPTKPSGSFWGASATLNSQEVALSTTRPYDPRLVSLPTAGSRPLSLSQFLSGQSRSLLEGRRSGLVRPRAAVMSVRRSGGTHSLYMDEVLSRRPYRLH